MEQLGLILVVVLLIIILSSVFKSLAKPRPPKRRLPNLTPPENGRTAEVLARRLECDLDMLVAIPINYQKFAIEKRSGGHRYIQAPDKTLKKIQRTILKRLLNKLPVHPAATGFEKGHSIVSNAFPHVSADIILRMDIKSFFTSTTADRLRGYLYGIGWDQESTDILVRLCTHEDALPQGAPTSPHLSNLINYELDSRLSGWAETIGAVYTRYADDMTFSFHNMNIASSIKRTAQNPKTLERVSCTFPSSQWVSYTRYLVRNILAEYGYKLHTKKKLSIRRRHQQQKVTGLVVNEHVALPRKTRRWLRAVQHRLENGKTATLTPDQFAGWQALQNMIDTQQESLTKE